MSQAQYTRGGVTPPVEARAFDADLNFLVRWAGPLGLLARAMLAYIFIVEGAGKIAGYSGVADYMQAHGVDGRLLPLVVLTELGGGLLVLVGLKTRWAAIELFGFCLLTALFFHSGADQAIQLQKNVAMAGLPCFGASRSRRLVTGRVARPRHLTKVAAGALDRSRR